MSVIGLFPGQEIPLVPDKDQGGPVQAEVVQHGLEVGEIGATF